MENLIPPKKAIQFVRSTPGIGTTLVGIKKEHVEENLFLAKIPPLTTDEF